MSSTHPYRLMTPGPVAVHPDVTKEMSLPLIHHRTPEFEQIFTRVLTRLRDVFQTKNPCFVLAGTGSGGMEALLVNTLSPGDEVLVIDSGKFGERWGDMAQAHGLVIDRLKVEWGHSADPEELAQYLRKRKYHAVLSQACESSTGALHPLAELAKIVRRHSEALFLVDGITAVGAAPLAMDEWELDGVVAGSQKAFMLPTGLTFVALSSRAWERKKHSTLPLYYWDLQAELQANQKHQSNFSSAVSLVRGLDRALILMLENGLAQHIARIAKLAQATRTAGEALGLKIFPQIPSPSLTVFALPPAIDGKKVCALMQERYNVTIAGGQDHLTGRIIRIGHMGAISNEDAICTMEFLSHILNEMAADKFSIATPELRAAMLATLSS